MRTSAIISFLRYHEAFVDHAEATNGPVRVVGRYALYGEIAAGGMATVHFGRLLGPVGFSRTVAIKRLHPQFAKNPEFVSMFLDEARLVRLARQRREQAPTRIVSAIVSGVLHGLHAAHEAKNERGEPLDLVHRD